ncbi:tRNA ligase [Yamadazyma tenuis]|uniref:tRNA ligase n=1 Tax=Candida tenuis TaxID=2315449 RepID=UPI00279C7AB2|nr:tRNA ligase [Yamadazyma tenuis]
MLNPVYDTDQELANLMAKLQHSTTLKKGGGKRNVYKVGGLDVCSWRFNEFEYARNLVPCNARGLFTVGNKIVVRGYDKFFNVGEVPQTKPQTLAADTTGPYELTVKENGCIVFIGGLEDGTIVVCSKHSTGARDDLTRNHAVEGESQLKHSLEAIGKSVEELAKMLYKHNITLVGELCDDSFEEHIMKYSGNDAGIYLHGINHNTIDFKTYPMDAVREFALIWGFKCVESFQKTSYTDLTSFLDKCQETGTWHNREIEGFVVRCKISEGGDFFFKYKFEQPYLLYRNFREVTKSYLNGKPYNELLKRYGKEKYILSKYISFITEYFDKNPDKRDLYLQNYGIIEVRNLFLQSLGLNEISGMNLLAINEELSRTMEFSQVINKYVLIPIATVGCGKTTVAAALVDLFGWGHIQNDNIANKSKNSLVKQCLRSLFTEEVVVCDRNNHQKRERKQLFEQFYQFKVDELPANTSLVFVALNFIPRNTNMKELHKITLDRITQRGDRHQSIKSSTDPKLAEKVLGGFISRFQPIAPNYEPDSEFDMIIDLDFKDSPADSVKKVISSLTSEFPLLIPSPTSDEAIDSAVAKALTYEPTFTKTFGSSATSKSKKKVDFFGIKVDHPTIVSVLNQHCTSSPEVKPYQSNVVLDQVATTFSNLSLNDAGPSEPVQSVTVADGTTVEIISLPVPRPTLWSQSLFAHFL